MTRTVLDRSNSITQPINGEHVGQNEISVVPPVVQQHNPRFDELPRLSSRESGLCEAQLGQNDQSRKRARFSSQFQQDAIVPESIFPVDFPDDLSQWMHWDAQLPDVGNPTSIGDHRPLNPFNLSGHSEQNANPGKRRRTEQPPGSEAALRSSVDNDACADAELHAIVTDLPVQVPHTPPDPSQESIMQVDLDQLLAGLMENAPQEAGNDVSSSVAPDTQHVRNVGCPPTNTSWSGGSAPNDIDDAWMNSADCGQYASDTRSGIYLVAPLGPQTGEQVTAPTLQAPTNFPQHAAMSRDVFLRTPIPALAEGIAYVQTSEDKKWHYAKIHRDSGAFSHLTQTDAFRHAQRGNGGTFSMLSPNAHGQLEVVAQRGVAPPERLDGIADFVQYTESKYGEGLYYFCKFNPAA
jgi:hypothetical protein